MTAPMTRWGLGAATKHARSVLVGGLLLALVTLPACSDGGPEVDAINCTELLEVLKDTYQQYYRAAASQIGESQERTAWNKASLRIEDRAKDLGCADMTDLPQLSDLMFGPEGSLPDAVTGR